MILNTAEADWHVFPSPDALAETLAEAIATMLDEAVAAREQAFLAVSGGSTPGRFFAALSRKKLNWRKVIVTLVDERFVPENSARSNAALVKQALLVDAAAQARFVGLYHDTATVEAAAMLADAEFAGMPWPLDVAILGMGTDGHTASFFADAANLDDLLDPARDTRVEPVHTKDGGEPRLTLPLGRLVEARFVALHIEGEEKRRVLEDALRPGATLPIGAVFRHALNPVPVYWAG